MKYSVRVLRRAEQDIMEIAAWLDRERPVAAVRIVDAILAGIERLGDAPLAGASPRDEILRARELRFVIVRSWIVFYKVRGRQVRVLRILHGKRDWLSLLKGR